MKAGYAQIQRDNANKNAVQKTTIDFTTMQHCTVVFLCKFLGGYDEKDYCFDDGGADRIGYAVRLL